MSLPKYKKLVEKSVSAAISSIEIYNKPDFKYREENFSILMINAWEILLKAKILKDNWWKINSIYIQDKKVTKTWAKTKRFYPKLNRSWNPMTLSISESMTILKLDKILFENIDLLILIRDNSTHFINDDKDLSKKILEIWTSNLKSYVTCCKDWFNYDLSKYNFYLMPISFFHTFEVTSFSVNNHSKQIENLKTYISNKETENPSTETWKHDISLIMQTKFVKSNEGLPVNYSSEWWALNVKIDSEEKFKRTYKYTYKQLIEKLKSSYPSTFKQGKEFNLHMKKFKQNERFCWVRYLNFNTKTWSKKEYYSPEIFKEFKQIYK